MKAEDNQPLGRAFTAPGLLLFALPTMAMMVFMGLYTFADTVFVSRLAGTDALAAMNVICPVTQVAVGLGTMLAAGGGAMIAQSMGKGDGLRARELFTAFALAAAVLGAILGAAGLAGMEPLLRLLGARGVLAGHGRAYLAVYLGFLPATMLQTLYANWFVTAGRPGLGAALAACGGLLNIALDALLMGGFHMGIRGAALGTGLGALMPAAAGTAFFILRGEGLRFARPRIRPGELLCALGNGASEMVGQLSGAVTTYLLNRAMLRFAGEDGVAGMTIVVYAQFLLSTAYIGFSMGVTPVIGYLCGAGKLTRLRRTVRICFGAILGSAWAVYVLARAFGPALIALYTGRDTAVYALTLEGFAVFSAGFLFCGVNIFTSSMLTALGEGRASALLSFLRTCVFLTAGILLLPCVFGVRGVFLASPLSEGLACMAAAGALLDKQVRRRLF